MTTEKKGSFRYISAVFLITFMAASAFAQISPGPLTTAHANLEGLSNCTKCHVLGKQVENFKCLACHTEIQDLINQNRGYHANPQVRSQNCASCHSEHHGRQFEIIHFDTKSFDHTLTGYPLKGKHATLQCRACHQTKFISSSEFEKRNGTYLGLSTSCSSCHEGPHQGTLGEDCASCHNENSFKPATKFKHDKTEFTLTGAHKKVECAKCHVSEVRNGKPFTQFAGVKFENCVPCHRDLHNGKFGEICEKCHTTVSFTLIEAKTFNHNLTDYPLIGMHADVSCRNCHGDNLNSRPKHALCTDCHKDAHHGDFTVNNVVENCADCHTVYGFKLTTFTIAMHDKGKFRLTGSHLAVPCESCHLSSNSWHFKNLGTQCIDCHKNVHGTELTEEFLPNDNCTSCHTTATWDKVAFDHNKTSFKLLGKHADVSCRSCHYRKNSAGVEVSVFRSLNPHCETCHRDIHFGQFAVQTKGGKFSECQNCHTFNNWSPTNFDHQKTKFPLTGAHAKLACIECHKEVTVNENTFIQYKLKDFRCAACHSS